MQLLESPTKFVAYFVDITANSCHFVCTVKPFEYLDQLLVGLELDVVVLEMKEK
jgi:hypothetical protein